MERLCGPLTTRRAESSSRKRSWGFARESHADVHGQVLRARGPGQEGPDAQLLVREGARGARQAPEARRNERHRSCRAQRRRRREEEERELAGIQEVVDRDHERLEQRDREKKAAEQRERQGLTRLTTSTTTTKGADSLAHSARKEGQLARRGKRASRKRTALRDCGCVQGALVLDGLWLGGRLVAQNWEFLEQVGCCCKPPATAHLAMLQSRVGCVVNVTSDVSLYYENDVAADGWLLLCFVADSQVCSQASRLCICECRFQEDWTGDGGGADCFTQVEDSSKADLKQFFSTSSAFIAEQRAAGRAVLVHCREGLSRSPAIVVAHLMQHHSLLLKVSSKQAGCAGSRCERQDALALVEERNGLTRINEGDLIVSSSTTLLSHAQAGFLRQLVELDEELFGAARCALHARLPSAATHEARDSVTLFDAKSRAVAVSYDDMTADEKRAWDEKQVRMRAVLCPKS